MLIFPDPKWMFFKGTLIRKKKGWRGFEYMATVLHLSSTDDIVLYFIAEIFALYMPHGHMVDFVSDHFDMFDVLMFSF